MKNSTKITNKPVLKTFNRKIEKDQKPHNPS